MKHILHCFSLLTEILPLILFWINNEYLADNDVEKLQTHIIKKV